MKNIDKFLDLLLEKCEKLKWFGRNRPGQFSSLKGSYKSRLTEFLGFEIAIFHHDYTSREKFPRGVPDGVWRRRPGLPRREEVLEWIDMSVIDRHTRFGRKKILDREILFPKTPLHEKMIGLLQEVEKVVVIFRPSEDERLSSEHAFCGICDLLATI